MSNIKTYKEKHLGWVVFDNSQKRNAINYKMWESIPEILEELNNDDHIKVIILRGAGRQVFTAGADLSEFKELRNNSATSNNYNRVTKEAFQAIKFSPKPVVAMIYGPCIGGGFALALQCDLRIAAKNSSFGIPAAKRGIAYGFEGTKDLVNIVGPAYAKEMFFTGRNYDTARALQMGLIHQSVEEEKLEELTREYCYEIASNAPLSIMSSKIAIMEYLKEPEERDLGKIEKAMTKCFDSDDYKEGYTAFLEKRRPNFVGK